MEISYSVSVVLFAEKYRKEVPHIKYYSRVMTMNEYRKTQLTGEIYSMKRQVNTKQKEERVSEKASANLPAPMTALAITSADAAGTIEKVRAASPDGFTMLNLDKISFATADNYTWNVPTADGPDPRRYLDVIMVHQHPARQRYSDPYDPAMPTPPVCVSYDGVRGHGEPGGLCAQCPYNQVGPDAECRPYRWLYLLFPDSIFPTFLSLPRTSLTRKLANGIARYLVDLAKGGRQKVKGGLWPWEVVTRITLAKRDRGVGMVAVFTEGPRLPADQASQVEKYVQDFRASLTFPTINAVIPGHDPTAFPREDDDDGVL